MSLSNKNILIGVSGSISAYKVCELISLLKKQGHDVKVIATPTALNFVGKASFEGLTGHAVITQDFQDGFMMSHIELAKWADLFLMAPATAQTLNSLASGTGHGVLVSTYLAYDLKKPLLIAPAMNTKMLTHPTTQASIDRLKKYGVHVLETGSGNLACGDIGLGRLMEPKDILTSMTQHLLPIKSVKILITAGGTKVPIDSVRSITNTSTGKTGSVLADYFTQKNYQVDLCLSQDGVSPKSTENIFRFTTYDDLAQLMETMIKKNKYDLIIHAAAVSDFKVAQTGKGKLASGAKQTLVLEPTEKLLKKIKTWSKKSRVVGFKLTDTPSVQQRKIAISKILAQGAELVVHNDLSQIGEAKHLFNVITSQEQFLDLNGPLALATKLESLISQQKPKEIYT